MSAAKRPRTILRRVGEQIKEARLAAGETQQDVANLLGWVGHDAVSKLEHGTLNLTLSDYLILVDYFREQMPPDHPAVMLLDVLRAD
jgi:transcriptional regulator with XRE-family HTH domain